LRVRVRHAVVACGERTEALTAAEVSPPDEDVEVECVVVPATAATEKSENSAAAIIVRFMICIPY
jgi:hypothetical protein